MLLIIPSTQYSSFSLCHAIVKFNADRFLSSLADALAIDEERSHDEPKEHLRARGRLFVYDVFPRSISRKVLFLESFVLYQHGLTQTLRPV